MPHLRKAIDAIVEQCKSQGGCCEFCRLQNVCIKIAGVPMDWATADKKIFTQKSMDKYYQECKAEGRLKEK